MDEREYVDHLKSIGVDVRTLAPDAKGTLAAAVPAVTIDDSDLPRLSVRREVTEEGEHADLALEKTIGTGGMATVWVASQSALGRRVAVKELRTERRTKVGRQSLMREARVTGGLEHPNIVPVHALGQTQEGWPLLVMKFIEGTPWKECLRPLYATPQAASPDDVEEQLRIFVQVCNAAHFAHSRGVVHRDLKPDNVMIGTFGEVYLVDWGLALRLDDAEQRVRGIVGTPGYMAPEMAEADGAALSTRTDVYLLGAVLHEVVTGGKRHDGNMMECLLQAHSSKPFEYEPWVPHELAQICNRATHRDPAERFPTAAQLRDAVQAFLRHRSSRELTREAIHRTETLRDALGGSIEVEPVTWSRLSTEARFSFRQALREWPENVGAQQGMQRLVEVLVEHELAHDNVRAAQALLAELDDPAPSLARRLEALEQRLQVQRSDAATLAQMRRDADLAVLTAPRRLFAVLNGVILAGGAGLLFALRSMGIYAPGYPAVIAVAVLLLANMLIALHYLSSRKSNVINLRVMGGVAAGLLGVVTLLTACWIAGVSLIDAEALTMVVAGAIAGVLGATVHKSLAWSAPPFVVAGFLVLAAPDYRGLSIAICGGIGFAIGALIWRNLGRETSG